MLGLRYLCPASNEVGGGESSQRTSLHNNWNQFLWLMLKVGLRGHPSDEDEDLWKTKIKSPSLLSREDQGRPGILLALTLTICVAVSVPEGLVNSGTCHQKGLNQVFGARHLFATATPSLVKQEVKGPGYTNTAGARN